MKKIYKYPYKLKAKNKIEFAKIVFLILNVFCCIYRNRSYNVTDLNLNVHRCTL